MEKQPEQKSSLLDDMLKAERQTVLILIILFALAAAALGTAIVETNSPEELGATRRRKKTGTGKTLGERIINFIYN